VAKSSAGLAAGVPGGVHLSREFPPFPHHSPHPRGYEAERGRNHFVSVNSSRAPSHVQMCW